SSRPPAKIVFVPSGLNFKMDRPAPVSAIDWSATNKFSDPSKARPMKLASFEVTTVLFTPSGENLKIEFSSETKRLSERSKAMPTELILVANVLLLPSGVNLRIEPLKVVAASSETKRFPLLSKHKPIGPLSPATKVLFVPSGVYLKTERLAKSATKRLPAASKASPLARTLTGINIVVRTVAEIGRAHV